MILKRINASPFYIITHQKLFLCKMNMIKVQVLAVIKNQNIIVQSMISVMALINQIKDSITTS